MKLLDHRTKVLFAVVAWIAVAVAGICLLQVNAATPGRSGPGPGVWPVGTSVVADPIRANLVMMVHPRCPCSRASLTELEKIMARCRSEVAAHVLFLDPQGTSASWRGKELWQHVAGLPGISSIPDPDGVEAKRFGAMTSGHVLLYSRAGTLLFSGGITRARGHEGESAGSDAIRQLLAGMVSDRVRADVFGCPLFEAENL